MILALIAMLALTRAEIVQRMRAPVLTQADGLVKVFASCSEPVRREYQSPVARFASDTVTSLYAAIVQKPVRFKDPGIIIFIQEGHTNSTDVLTRVETNGASRIVSRLIVLNPGIVDLDLFRAEIGKAFFRSVKGEEVSFEYVRTLLRRVNPTLRVADERAKLEDWLAGGKVDDDTGFSLLRKIIEPGVASRRDVLIFASRLFLYPRTFDEKFIGGADTLSFREAVKVAMSDPRVRAIAYFKARELPVWAGGRGDGLVRSAAAYSEFLFELAKGERTEQELDAMLDQADAQLKQVLENAK